MGTSKYFHQLCPEEVDTAAWLSVNLIRLAVWSKDEPEDSNEFIPVTFVNKDGGEFTSLCFTTVMCLT